MAEYQDRNQNDAYGADHAQQGWQSNGTENGGQGADGWNQGQGWNNGSGWNQGQGWNNGNGWNNSQSSQGWNNGNGSNGWSGNGYGANGSDRSYGNGSGKRLTRSYSNRMICGVCAGIAEYFNWDPTIVRLIWVGVSILFGAGFMGMIAYFIVAVIMPER